MKIKEHLIKNKKFLKDNFILFIGLFTLNLLGYFFHFYVGRKLGPSDYGVFGSLLSLIYIIAMPLQAIQTTITKFVANFKAKDEVNKIAYLLERSLKKMGVLGVGVFIIFLLLIPFLSKFLKIDDYKPLIVLSLFLFLSLLIPVVRGILQGLQKFKLLGISYIFEGITKLTTGIFLVSVGFGVSGAIGGFALSYVAAFVITIYFLIRYLKIGKEKFNTSEIYRYSFPVLVMLISLTGFYTIDLLLVKHFFNATEAGYYAALSLLGKIIFFGTLSICMVMFSKVAEDYANNQNTRKNLYKSLLLVSLWGFGITSFYFLFPRFTINLLFGKEFFAMSNLLGLFALFMTIFSLVYILAFYNASIHRKNFVYILVLFNLIEIGAITFFHENLMQVVVMLFGLISILFISLLFYTFSINEKTIDSDSCI